jgi:hypothetical protein
MGVREDFDQALHRGDFAGAARAWAVGNLRGDEGVQAFEAKLEASLEDRQFVLGESLTLANGEYSYLGNDGKDGARLAYLPHNGSLDDITYLHDQDELVAHLVSIGASQLDKETVVAFFAVSERQSYELSQAERAPTLQQPAMAAPAAVRATAPTATQAQTLSPEDTVRAMIEQMGDSPELAEAVVQLASKDFKNNRVHAGTIIAFGHAPYLHDTKNTQSFYVSLGSPNQLGETVWGKELEAAMLEGGLKAGAAVVLSHQGSKTVTVQVPERDESGAQTGRMVDAPAQRNSWKAVPLERLHEQAVEQLAAQELAQQPGASETVAIPAPVMDFKTRMQNATWFYDTIDGEDERANGQQSLGQLREDFKALMIDYPVEAAEVWRTEAPVEFQPELSDLLAQLENAAPGVIKAHKEHDLAEALQQEGAEHQAQDAIQAAPAVLAEAREKDEDAIQPVERRDGENKLKKQAVDAISRIAASGADAISDAGSSKRAETESTQTQQDAADGSPKTLLNGRFILRDEGQYFRVADGVESTRVALVDEASKIRFVDKQMDTFQAAIELAKHKQWEAILVTGSEKFRSEAWHHARMAGLEVVGYEPSEKDVATLKAAQEARTKVNHGKAPTAPAASPVDVEKAKSLQAANDHAIDAGYGVSEAKVESGRHVGKVIHETDKHIVQDVGRKVAVVHDKEVFDRQALRTAMEKGKPLKIQYDDGRAAIEGNKERSQERSR